MCEHAASQSIAGLELRAHQLSALPVAHPSRFAWGRQLSRSVGHIWRLACRVPEPLAWHSRETNLPGPMHSSSCSLLQARTALVVHRHSHQPFDPASHNRQRTAPPLSTSRQAERTDRQQPAHAQSRPTDQLKLLHLTPPPRSAVRAHQGSPRADDTPIERLPRNEAQQWTAVRLRLQLGCCSRRAIRMRSTRMG